MENSLPRILLLFVVTPVLTLCGSVPLLNGVPVLLRQSAATSQKSDPELSSTPSLDVQTQDVQTQEALAFTGRVLIMKGQIVLDDPTTKVTYQLNDQSKAKQYLGRQVKVTGKLQMNSNTIQIERIEPLS
jgi:hypothetical protein